MGIRHEIERLRLEEQARLNQTRRQRGRLIGEIKATDERLRAAAREFAIPYSQKLRESGAVEVLGELREAEGLRLHDNEWKYPFPGSSGLGELVRPILRFYKDPTPARLDIRVKVERGGDLYSFCGFDLVPISTPQFPIPLKEMTPDQLQECYKHYNETSPAKDLGMVDCSTELTWGQCATGWYERKSNSLSFSLSRRDDIYWLVLTGGTSFPESSWSKSVLEKAVAEAFHYNVGYASYSTITAPDNDWY